MSIYKDTQYKILMIGTFPPPIHGMAEANLAVSERLFAEGLVAEKLDTSNRSLSRRIMARMGRIPVITRVWWRLASAKFGNGKVRPVAYISLSGGWGQIYDLVTVVICRARGLPCVLHHHSVAYLSKKSLLTAWLCQAAGLNTAAHVVLCQSMGQWLKSLYGVGRVAVLSNSALFPLNPELQAREALRVVGFLSNVTREKGGECVIALARAIRQRNWPLRVVVAGPCHDEHLVEALNASAEEGILEWLGPVYGEDKSQFWKMTDAFVFPTQYANEAEPLVLWEAMAAGVPAISYGRGCIVSQLETGGVAIATDKDFVEEALEILEGWQDPFRFREASEQARHRYADACATGVTAWADFIRLLERG